MNVAKFTFPPKTKFQPEPKQQSMQSMDKLEPIEAKGVKDNNLKDPKENIKDIKDPKEVKDNKDGKDKDIKDNKENKPKVPEPLKEDVKTVAKKSEILNEREIKFRIDSFKQEQNHEMLLVLEEEQVNEANREELLRKTTDPKERKKLETICSLKRSKALTRIQDLAV